MSVESESVERGKSVKSESVESSNSVKLKSESDESPDPPPLFLTFMESPYSVSPQHKGTVMDGMRWI